MSTTCVIGARGGSKGVANKKIRPILGKPLIAWSIEQALACPEIDRVVISTDSAAIAEVARAAGAETPFPRPPELARAANSLVREFGLVIAEVVSAVEDHRVSGTEAQELRGRWDALRKRAEGFIRACERGDFSPEG